MGIFIWGKGEPSFSISVVPMDHKNPFLFFRLVFGVINEMQMLFAPRIVLFDLPMDQSFKNMCPGHLTKNGVVRLIVRVEDRI